MHKAFWKSDINGLDKLVLALNYRLQQLILRKSLVSCDNLSDQIVVRDLRRMRLV